MDVLDYRGDIRATLCHYNLFHDPNTGQFTSAPFGREKYVKPDGTLTAEGRARWEHDKKKNAQKKKDDRIKDDELEKLIDPHRWVKEDMDALQAGLTNAQQFTKAMSDMEKKKLASRPAVRKKTLDLTNITDQELKTQIDRYLLEQKYQDIFNPKEQPPVSTGKKWLLNTLDIAGGALAVGVSAVTIAKAVHDLKKK